MGRQSCRRRWGIKFRQLCLPTLKKGLKAKFQRARFSVDPDMLVCSVTFDVPDYGYDYEITPAVLIGLTVILCFL